MEGNDEIRLKALEMQRASLGDRNFLDSHLEELSARQEALGKDHHSVAEILNTIGLFLHHKANDQNRALEHHKEALRVLRVCSQSRRVRGNDQSDPQNSSVETEIAVTLTDIGNVNFKQNNYDEAMGAYVEALDIFKVTENSSESHRVSAVLRGINRMRGSDQIDHLIKSWKKL